VRPWLASGYLSISSVVPGGDSGKSPETARFPVKQPEIGLVFGEAKPKIGTPRERGRAKAPAFCLAS